MTSTSARMSAAPGGHPEADQLRRQLPGERGATEGRRQEAGQRDADLDRGEEPVGVLGEPGDGLAAAPAARHARAPGRRAGRPARSRRRRTCCRSGRRRRSARCWRGCRSLSVTFVHAHNDSGLPMPSRPDRVCDVTNLAGVPVLTDGVVTLRAHRPDDVRRRPRAVHRPGEPEVDHRAGALLPGRRPVLRHRRGPRRLGLGHLGLRGGGRRRRRHPAVLRHRGAARPGQPAGRDRLRLAPVGAGPRDHAPRPVPAAGLGVRAAAAASGDLVGERRQLGVAARRVAAGLQLRRHGAALGDPARRAARRLGRGAARRRRAHPAHRLAAGAAGHRGASSAAQPARRRRRQDRRGLHRRAHLRLDRWHHPAIHGHPGTRVDVLVRRGPRDRSRRHLGHGRPRHRPARRCCQRLRDQGPARGGDRVLGRIPRPAGAA